MPQLYNKTLAKLTRKYTFTHTHTLASGPFNCLHMICAG